MGESNILENSLKSVSKNSLKVVVVIFKLGL